nr:hypothetical protein [Tanacetum cinerariifolium]
FLLVPCCWERWKRVVGSVVEVVEWTGVEENGFPAQSVGSSSIKVLDSPCLLVLITETSQSRQHVLTKSKPVSVTAARPVSAAVPKIMITRPKHARSLNTTSNSTIRRHKTHSQSSKISNSSPKVTAAKAQVVSAAKGKKGKWA